ncbi:MAG: hypothetical protein HGA98_02290 [Deltaproteobacteria bacterium]|nr:hypothetical protein [Deltaproteobacteria bacterium]
MSKNVLHWVVTPLILVLIVLLRLWGNRIINRKRAGAEKDGEPKEQTEAGALRSDAGSGTTSPRPPTRPTRRDRRTR